MEHLTASLGIRLGGGGDGTGSLKRFTLRVNKLFARMDEDKSGTLSVEEILEHLKKMGMRQAEPDHIRSSTSQL